MASDLRIFTKRFFLQKWSIRCETSLQNEYIFREIAPVLRNFTQLVFPQTDSIRFENFYKKIFSSEIEHQV